MVHTRRRLTAFFLIVGLAAWFIHPFQSGVAAEEHRGPNIVFILADEKGDATHCRPPNPAEER
jgi:hypothetical protein